MKVLTSILPNVRQFVPVGHGWFTFCTLSILFCLEVFGRLVANQDFYDAISIVVVLSFCTFALIRHRYRPHPLLNRLGDFLYDLEKKLAGLKSQLGVDYRGEPQLPQKLPRKAWLLPTVLCVLCLLASAAWKQSPEGWRSFCLYAPYFIYVGCLSLLWFGLVFIIIAGVYLPYKSFGPTIDHYLDGASTSFFAVYIIACLLLTFSVAPVWPVTIGGLLLLTSIFGYLRTQESVPALIWKGQFSKQLSCIPFTKLLAFIVSCLTMTVLSLVIISVGRYMFELPESIKVISLPITIYLGAFTAWFIPGLVAVVISFFWHDNPSYRTPPQLLIANPIPSTSLKSIRSLISKWGWRISSSTNILNGKDKKPAEFETVKVEIVEKEQSQAREFEPSWPLKICIEDLNDELVKDRLIRRDELQLRRKGFRGFEKMFKQIGKGGRGILFAPHWWFIEAIGREDENDHEESDPGMMAMKSVGPSYESVLPSRVRQHWYQVLRSTQVDMIFFEDGIKSKTMEKVLRQILEVYDRTAGKKPLEEMHFNGILKIRVLIHEYGTAKEYDVGEEYPEAIYKDLTRARILHIFKDRGDQPELNDIPFDQSWEPSPLMLV